MLGRKATEAVRHSHPTYRVRAVTTACAAAIDSIAWLRGVCQAFCCEATPFFHTVVCGGKSLCTTRFLEGRVSASVIWDSFAWEICLLSHVYFFQCLSCISIDSWVLMYIALYFSPTLVSLLKLPQLWPLGVLTVGSHTPLARHHVVSFFLFEHFLTF